MKRLPNRCYFVVNGNIYALKISEAYDVAKEASQTGIFNLEKQGKLLKRKTNVALLQRPLTFLILDLNRLDWQRIADQLLNIIKEKAIIC